MSSPSPRPHRGGPDRRRRGRPRRASSPGRRSTSSADGHLHTDRRHAGPPRIPRSCLGRALASDVLPSPRGYLPSDIEPRCPHSRSRFWVSRSYSERKHLLTSRHSHQHPRRTARYKPSPTMAGQSMVPRAISKQRRRADARCNNSCQSQARPSQRIRSPLNSTTRKCNQNRDHRSGHRPDPPRQHRSLDCLPHGRVLPLHPVHSLYIGPIYRHVPRANGFGVPKLRILDNSSLRVLPYQRHPSSSSLGWAGSLSLDSAISGR